MRAMSGAEFTLTSHEVMRGLKVHAGDLILRPGGAALFNTVLDVAAPIVAAVLAIVAGGWWALITAPALLMLVDAVQRLRVAVIAGSDCVVVRNRRRLRVVPISEFNVATIELVRWFIRQPLYVFHGWLPWRRYEICVIRTTSGKEIQCDALVSWPGDLVDPSPIAMKVSALNRWVDAHRATEP
jgi:hypothetical protein